MKLRVRPSGKAQWPQNLPKQLEKTNENLRNLFRGPEGPMRVLVALGVIDQTQELTQPPTRPLIDQEINHRIKKQTLLSFVSFANVETREHQCLCQVM